MNPSFTTKYTLINKIGEGSFSEVLKCEEKATKKFYAAKRLKKTFKNTYEVANCAEIIAMNKLDRHANIVYMLEFHYDPGSGQLIFIFELMDMSLYDFMKLKKRRMPETKVKSYFYQILKGLDHLHSHGLFHRDIKPENILIKMPKLCSSCPPYQSDLGEIVKLADFGSIRGTFSKPPYTEYISTRWYRSPECLLSVGYYGPKMDVWAAGCVFYEMLTLKPMFPGQDEIDQLAKIHEIIGTPNERMIRKLKKRSRNFSSFPKQTGAGIKTITGKIGEDFVTVIQLMMQYDPETRINVRRLLDHKFFKNLREDDNLLKIKYSKEYSNEILGRSKGDFSSLFTFPMDPKKNKYKSTASRSSGRGPNKSGLLDSSKTTVDIAFCKPDLKQNHNLLSNQIPLVGQKQMKAWGVNPSILKPKTELKKKIDPRVYSNKSQQFKLKQSNASEVHKYSKTTSNLPQAPIYSTYGNVKSKQYQSKSFVLPSRYNTLAEKKTENIEPSPVRKCNQTYKGKKKA